jgi:hypothetical protein
MRSSFETEREIRKNPVLRFEMVQAALRVIADGLIAFADLVWVAAERCARLLWRRLRSSLPGAAWAPQGQEHRPGTSV